MTQCWIVRTDPGFSLKHALHSLVLLSLLAITLPLRAAEVAGVHLDEQIKVGDTALTLNGAGLRNKFFIKVYAMGLYLPGKTREAAHAIAQAGPKRIQIVTLRDVGAEMFVEGLTRGIEKNTGPGELAALKPRMNQFAALLKGLDEIQKGSVVALDLLPGGATRLSVNGRAIGQDIPGDDFYRALLRIWLGNAPAQDDLKQSLLDIR